MAATIIHLIADQCCHALATAGPAAILGAPTLWGRDPTGLQRVLETAAVVDSLDSVKATGKSAVELIRAARNKVVEAASWKHSQAAMVHIGASWQLGH